MPARRAIWLVAGFAVLLVLALWLLNRGKPRVSGPIETTTTLSPRKPEEPPALARPAPPLRKDTLAPFARRLEAAQRSLPTQAELRALPPEETHHTPEALLRAGETIAGIAEELEKEPRLAPEGLRFYGECARRAEVSTTVRALCLVNGRELANKSSAAFDERGIDAEVVRLASALAGGS